MKSKRFGTFGGVFTPNVLCILGVISFLRAGWVVGNAGLAGALAIIVIANLITLATALSLSAIATNMEVKGGGAYYIISRSLGAEIGGAIGIPLCLSQVLSVALYILGFTESVRVLAPQWDPRLVSSAVCVALAVVSIVGASLAVRVQYVIMAALALAYGSFFLGKLPTPSHVALWPAYEKGYGFWSVFAVFFPAVTGIMAGASMSGDLRDPQRSIPRGTLWAIGVTFLVYVWQAVWLALNAPRADLQRDTFIMRRIAAVPALIYGGVWAATLSSALASLVAAPRTMQALAKDRVLPRLLGRGSGPSEEPRWATAVTFLVAEACILLGDLNVIAPVITMFFLTTYAATNLAAGLERLVNNPSFRPAFRVHWGVSLAGAGGCLYAMLLINPTASAVAAAATAGVYIYLRRRRLRARWGDVRSGMWFSLARFALLQVQEHKPDPKNWRPNVIVFSGNPRTRRSLVDLALWLGEGRGIVTLCCLLLTDDPDPRAAREAAQRQIESFIRAHRLEAFGLAEAAPDLRQGVCNVARLHGMAGLTHNVALLGWSEEPSRRREYAGAIRGLIGMGKDVLVLKCDPDAPFGRRRRIHIWWGGLQQNGPLMAMIAHLLRRNPAWEQAEIDLFMVIRDEAGRRRAEENLKRLLAQARIDARPQALVADLARRPIHELMAERSGQADLALLGMAEPAEGKEEEFMERLDAFVSGLPNALLVRSAGETDLFA